jgi:hypothetical protein
VNSCPSAMPAQDVAQCQACPSQGCIKHKSCVGTPTVPRDQRLFFDLRSILRSILRGWDRIMTAASRRPAHSSREYSATFQTQFSLASLSHNRDLNLPSIRYSTQADRLQRTQRPDRGTLWLTILVVVRLFIRRCETYHQGRPGPGCT